VRFHSLAHSLIARSWIITRTVGIIVGVMKLRDWPLLTPHSPRRPTLDKKDGDVEGASLLE